MGCGDPPSRWCTRIADGSLPHETFRRYFTQNVLYLEDYARAIGIIVGKAPDRDAITTLTRFLAQIVEDEIPANLAFLERLGGDPDTVRRPRHDAAGHLRVHAAPPVGLRAR